MRIIAGFTLLLLLLLPSQAHALSCATMPDMESGYGKYDAVIIGTVAKVEQMQHSNRLELDVVKSYKGVDERHISVEEDATWGALTGPSEKGAKYLFFLKKKDGGWENPLCAPSVKVTDTFVEPEFLRDKEVPLKAIDRPAVDEEAAPDSPTVLDSPPVQKVADKAESIRWGEAAIPVLLAGVLIFGMMRNRRGTGSK